MLKTSLVTLFLSLTVLLNAQESPSKTTRKQFKELEWITGQWNRTNVRAGRLATETWKKASKTSYNGIGVTVEGNDTTFVEKLSIEIKGDKIYYIADVSQNQEPTYFEITEITEKGFVSRNPDHDFPKMISYSLKGDELTAVISDGGDKKMGFTFKRNK